MDFKIEPINNGNNVKYIVLAVEKEVNEDNAIAEGRTKPEALLNGYKSLKQWAKFTNTSADEHCIFFDYKIKEDDDNESE